MPLQGDPQTPHNAPSGPNHCAGRGSPYPLVGDVSDATNSYEQGSRTWPHLAYLPQPLGLHLEARGSWEACATTRADKVQHGPSLSKERFNMVPLCRRKLYLPLCRGMSSWVEHTPLYYFIWFSYGFHMMSHGFI